MQRVPTRGTPLSKHVDEDVSPLLRLARRIRAEQGAGQVKSFIRAMEPFAAPGELRRVAEEFGIEYEYDDVNREKTNDTRSTQNPQNNGMDMMRMLQMLMQLKSLSGGANDAAKLLGMLNANK